MEILTPITLWTSISVFAGCLVLAAISDGRTMTIPNWASIAIVLAYLPWAFASGQPFLSILVHLGVGVGLFALGALLFARGIIGGGDAKLLAATTVWMGVEKLSAFLILIAIFGGLLAGLTLMCRKVWAGKPGGPALKWLNPPEGGVVGIPYGIAIALAGLVVIALTMTSATDLTF